MKYSIWIFTLLVLGMLAGCNLFAEEAVIGQTDAKSRTALIGNYLDSKGRPYEIQLSEGSSLEYIGPAKVIFSATATHEERVLFRQNVRYKSEEEKAVRPRSDIVRQLDEMVRQSTKGGALVRRDRWLLGAASLGAGWYLAQTLRVYQFSMDSNHVPRPGELWLLHHNRGELIIYPTSKCGGGCLQTYRRIAEN